MNVKAALRKINAVLGVLMLALFLFHGLGNAFSLVDLGSGPSKVFSHALLSICVVHIVISAWLTVDSFRAQRQAGVAYWRLNRRFWSVRASGLAIALFIVAHLLIFYRPSAAPVILKPFGPVELACSILLVLSIAVHVVGNAHPLMISLGIPAGKARAADLVVALSFMLLFMAVAFVVYNLRWRVI